MKTLAIINPNTSETTTAMMTRIVRDALPRGSGWEVEGITARLGPPMIVDVSALRESVAQVVQSMTALCSRAQGGPDAVIVGAIGDPGLAELRELFEIPAYGLAESALLEAARDGRAFGIATTTPGLVSALEARVVDLGLHKQFTGIRLTKADPMTLVANPEMLRASLQECVENCLENDGAEAVVIGGGPLSQAAKTLQSLYYGAVIMPLESALQQVLQSRSGQRHT